MNNIKMRGYQKKQVNFIVGNSDKPLISLQSPTGSGKSFVMFQAIKTMLEKDKGRQFAIVTGFNNLVYQLEQSAMEFGFKPTVLMSIKKSHCLLKAQGTKAFYPNINPNVFPDTWNCKNCEHRKENATPCLYDEAIHQSAKSQLIITNHAYFLSHQKWFCNRYIFFDECHVFPDFYQNYMSAEITIDTLVNIYCKSTEAYKSGIRVKNDPKFSPAVLKSQVNKKNVSPVAIDKCLQLVEDPEFIPAELDKKSESEFEETSKEVQKMLAMEEGNKTDFFKENEVNVKGDFIGLKYTKFFDKIDLEIDFKGCLVSATVDDYTKSVFDVNCNYVEENCNIIDYTKSNIYLKEDFSEEGLTEILQNEKGKHGLFLSTQLSLVNRYKNANIAGFSFTAKRFSSDDKQVLIGSKKLFQGIDIEGVDFVVLNKIPFDPYNECSKAFNKYLTKNGRNPWSYYTIPHTENTITQAIGRLWRKKGDKGNIYIFDERAKLKFFYMIRDCADYRKGINVVNDD